MHVTQPKGWLALVALGLLVLGATVWGVVGSVPLEIGGQQGVLLHSGARHAVVTQVPGLVVDVLIDEGELVEEGQTVARVQLAGGSRVDVATLFSGRVDELVVQKGMVVPVGQQLAIVEDGDKPLQAVALVPIDSAKELSPGMEVHVSPSTAKSEDYGFMRGVVASVSEFPVTRQQAEELFLNQSLVDTLYTADNQLQVVVDLVPNSATRSGFQWSSSAGPPFRLSHGTICTLTFVLGEEHPLNLVVPSGQTGGGG